MPLIMPGIPSRTMLLQPDGILLRHDKVVLEAMCSGFISFLRYKMPSYDSWARIALTSHGHARASEQTPSHPSTSQSPCTPPLSTALRPPVPFTEGQSGLSHELPHHERDELVQNIPAAYYLLRRTTHPLRRGPSPQPVTRARLLESRSHQPR